MRMREPGRTTALGYGADWQKLRAKVKREVVDPGNATCWRCGGWINPSMPWDLGHDDHDRSIVRGPEHRGVECPKGGNRATQRHDRKTAAHRPPSRWVL